MKNSIGHSLPICSRLTSPRPRWILTRMEFPAKTTSTTVSAMWRWSRRWCILALTTLIWSYSLQVLGAVHIDYVITDGGGSAETPKLYYVIYEQPLLIRHTDDWYYCLYAVLKYFRSISRGPFLTSWLNFFSLSNLPSSGGPHPVHIFLLGLWSLPLPRLNFLLI